MPSEPTEFKHLLARNLRAARAATELSQEQVRKGMNSLGFTSWLGSTVSLVMRGERRVTTEELIGLALVLNVKPERLIWPENGQDLVSLPSGFTFPALRLVMNDGSVTWKDGKPVAGRSQVRELAPDAARELRGLLGVGEGEHFSVTLRPGDQ